MHKVDLFDADRIGGNLTSGGMWGVSSGRGNGEEGLTIPSSIHSGGQSKKCDKSWFHPVIEIYESFSVAT